MMKLRTLTASLLISTCFAGHTMAQESLQGTAVSPQA